MESENKYETFPGWKGNTNDVWERTPNGGKELTNGEVRDRLNTLEANLSEALNMLRFYGKNLDLTEAQRLPALNFVSRIESEGGNT